MTTPRLVSSCGQHAGDDAAPEVRAPAFTRTGADVQRTDRARRFSTALHGALADTCGAGGLARALGASETLVRDWANPEHERQMPAHDFLALPADVRAALDLRTGAAPATPASASPESAHRRLSALVGEVADMIDRSLADGVIDVRERQQLARLMGSVARRALAEQAALESAT